MILLEIKSQKKFMNALLLSESFDHFLLVEASIHNKISYHIDGRILKDTLPSTLLEEEHLLDFAYLPFAQVKHQCLQMIKGSLSPSFLKFVLVLSPENLEKTLLASNTHFTSKDISSLSINFTLKNNKLLCTPGISYQTFSPDHSLDAHWDSLVKRFLLKNNIDFEEI